MVSGSSEQFLTVPETVTSAPGQAAGVTELVSSTQGLALQVTEASACAPTALEPPLMQFELNVPSTSTTFVTVPKHSAEDCASNAIVQLAPAARSNGPNLIVWPCTSTAPPHEFERLAA